MTPGDRVHIIPISEDGMVLRCRKDDFGEPIITVIRDSDKESHVCRLMEIKPVGETTCNQQGR